MRILYSLIVAALVVSGDAAAQGIDCPDVNFTTEVGTGSITLRWSDPPESARTEVTLSLNKVSNFLPGEDSTALSWRGTSLPTIGGHYVGNCDFIYKFKSLNNVPNFSTVDTARVGPGWSGTSFPTSGGTFRSCVDSLAFHFTLIDGGAISPTGGD